MATTCEPVEHVASPKAGNGANPNSSTVDRLPGYEEVIKLVERAVQEAADWGLVHAPAGPVGNAGQGLRAMGSQRRQGQRLAQERPTPLYFTARGSRTGLTCSAD